MKVYNKNDLIGGINRIWMSVIWIALAVGEKGKTQWICAGLLVVSSIVLIMRAVKKPSAGEQIAALDERNQMIDLKSKSRTYDIMNVLDVVLMMICWHRYRHRGYCRVSGTEHHVQLLQ